MTFSLVTAANWPIVGQLCWLLGKVMDFIYTMLTDTFNLQNGVVGLSIIIYTIIVYTCMLPMTRTNVIKTIPDCNNVILADYYCPNLRSA